MKKASELVIVHKFKSISEEERFNAVKKIVIDLVVREWQKKNL